MLLTFYIKTFKILTCSVLILGLKLYRFGLFSKGFYCLLFNVLFCSSLMWNDLHYTIPFCVCQHFFDIFLKTFLLFLRQNKKLVIDVLFYSFSYFFLLILMFSFLFFVCCLVLIYINILFYKSQYIF